MDNQGINPHDRVELFVAGVKLSARPIDFEYDKNRNPIKAIKYETTCPKCGNMLQFMGVQNSIACTVCGAVDAVIADPSIVVRHGVAARRKSDDQAQRGCPFIDPMEAGVFQLDAPKGE